MTTQEYDPGEFESSPMGGLVRRREWNTRDTAELVLSPMGGLVRPSPIVYNRTPVAPLRAPTPPAPRPTTEAAAAIGPVVARPSHAAPPPAPVPQAPAPPLRAQTPLPAAPAPTPVGSGNVGATDEEIARHAYAQARAYVERGRGTTTIRNLFGHLLSSPEMTGTFCEVNIGR